jgi:uncharacterized protein YoxC
MEQTIQTLAVRVDKLERDSAELTDRVNAAAVAQAAISEKLNSVLVTLGEVKEAVARLELAPSRRLDGIIRAALTALASGIVGYFLARL